MFPSPVRRSGGFVVDKTKSSTMWLYHFVRSAIWITVTSSIILILPVAVEVSQIQAADEMKKVRKEKLFEAK